MRNDLRNKAVLITGGTKGIGRATGLAFARAGAQVYLTHKWASADPEELRADFTAAGAALPPVVLEADAALEEDTAGVMETIRSGHQQLEVLVSNVCVVPIVQGIESITKRALLKSLEHSAWPLIAHMQRAQRVFGGHPRYIIGLSSDGPDNYYQGYEFVAVAKAVMEVFGRYLTRYLLGQDVRINMVRTRNVITESALAVHGESYPDFVRRFASERNFIEPAEVANVILALCSGLLDAMAGQVITVDRGGSFSDNLMRVYRHREEYGL